jgi:hypothetical protein
MKIKGGMAHGTVFASFVLLTSKSLPSGKGFTFRREKTEVRSKKKGKMVGALSHPGAAAPDCGAVHSVF